MDQNNKNNPTIELYKKELMESCTGGKGIPRIIKEVPNIFETITKLIKDVDITNEERMLSYAAIGYFFVPDDLYPEEILGQIGYIDDVLLSLTVFQEIRSTMIGAEALERNWCLNFGVEEVMDTIYPSLIKKYSNEYISVLDHIGILPDNIDLVIE